MNKGFVLLIGAILTAIFCSLITYFTDNETMTPIYIGGTVFIILVLINIINTKIDKRKNKDK
ncbi:hypothetical protein NGH92_08750 [Staphylococcus succinus]|uniref:hypothetical protein n=1 Tax=Staphylococcus TaxID=1279 RepID=UPI0008F4E44B|nr:MULTISPECIES: hypothetical protein [Staphylococcus]MEB8124918.1 hypothetical protein [Staphylococcus succinus]OIJ28911.1 hypothetical protein BK821_13050 [Staphylococcus sp. LCT-H4]